jgi:hypothetical protein
MVARAAGSTPHLVVACETKGRDRTRSTVAARTRIAGAPVHDFSMTACELPRMRLVLQARGRRMVRSLHTHELMTRRARKTIRLLESSVVRRESSIVPRESSVVPRMEPSFDEQKVEAWTLPLDPIARIVRGALTEALIPLQESVQALAEENAALRRRIDVLMASRLVAVGAAPSPPRARATTMLPPPFPPGAQSLPGPSIPPPPPPPSSLHVTPHPASSSEVTPAPSSSPSCLSRFGGLAKKLREEKGVDVTAVELAGLLLERIAAKLDSAAGEELMQEIERRRETGRDPL